METCTGGAKPRGGKQRGRGVALNRQEASADEWVARATGEKIGKPCGGVPIPTLAGVSHRANCGRDVVLRGATRRLAICANIAGPHGGGRGGSDARAD